MVPVVASNRVGREDFSDSHIVFYGSSFIAGQTGEVLSECSYAPGGAGTARAAGGAGGPDAPREGGSLVTATAAAAPAAEAGSGNSRHFRCDGEEGGSGGEVILHTFDLESIRLQRAGWGLFRDRRPSLYRPLLSLDGT